MKEKDNYFKGPLSLSDVGIGGGEAYILSDANGNSRYFGMIMQSYTVKLIYPDKEITGSFFSGGKDYITLGYDGDLHKHELKNCDLEVLEEIKHND